MVAGGSFVKTETTIILLRAGSLAPRRERLIAAALRADAVLAYPTETFYGLGVLAFSEKAVEKVFRLKRRDMGKPLSLVVSDMAMAEDISASMPPIARDLAREFWPGPLTLVLKAKPVFPRAMLGPGGSVAVRVPGPAWLRALIRRLGVPLTATSANISGEGEISDPARLVQLFQSKVELIIDGGRTPGGLPSTIIDLTAPRPRILRPGAVPAAVLRKFSV